VPNGYNIRIAQRSAAIPSAGFHKARFEIPRWTTLEGVEALGNSSRVSKQKPQSV